MASRKKSDVFVCGRDDEAMMRYFEQLSSDSSSSDDEMDSDNIIPVSLNQSRAVYNNANDSSSESDDENTAMDTGCGDAIDWKWEQILAEPVCHPFTGVSGITPNLNLGNDSSRAAIFSLYMNDNVVEHIVEQTNKYGSSDSTFVSTTPDEFRVYLALLILMGIVQKPSLQSYWSKDVAVDTPYFRSVMPRRRFVSLNRYLHLVDNETLDPTDPLRKIRPIITMASDSFREIYTPTGSVCIDESLMKCRGRLHFIQFNKSKRARFGIKFYKLCDSGNSYICDFKIYVGKDKTDGIPASTAIVMEMMQKCDLLNKGYSLYIDNWYSSPDLFHRLFSAGTNVCGTVRTNRKNMPKELAKEKIKVGEAVAYSSNHITSMKWKDKRDVCMLSTKHTLDFAETGKVHRKTKTKILKPTAVIDYNKKMRGVDVGDQIMSKFHVMRRYSKAYKKIFFYVVDMMLLNSYVLYKQLHGKKDRTFHVFKQKLAEELLAVHFKEDVVKRRSVTPGDLPSRLSGRHFPEKLAPSAAKGAKFAKRCVVCLEKKQRKESTWKCDNCNVALCLEHFKPYHTLKNY